MPSGQVVRYDDKGWGFIRPDTGGRDVFFHIADVAEVDRDHMGTGQLVVFEVTTGERGPRAAVISLVPGGKTGRVPDRAAGCDVLTEGELRRLVDEILAETAAQFMGTARRYGWIR